MDLISVPHVPIVMRDTVGVGSCWENKGAIFILGQFNALQINL